MMIRRSFPFVVALAACVTAGPALAQPGQEPARPYRGVYAGGTSGWEQSLTLNLGLGAGFDYVTFDRAAAEAGGRRRRSGGGADATTSLNYSIGRQLFGVVTSFSGVVRYYPSLSESFIVARTFDFDTWLSLSSRTAVETNVDVAYRPAAELNYFVSRGGRGNEQPIDPTGILPDPEDAVGPRYLSATVEVAAEYKLTARSSLTGSYALQQALYDAEIAPDQFSWVASGGIAHAVSSDLSLRFRYAHQTGEYSPVLERRFVVHTIDAGIDLERPLSRSRRTTLAVNTGMAAVSDDNETRSLVTVHARLQRQIGRSWTAGLNYSRDVQFVGTLREPLFADQVGAAFGGLISRRVAIATSLDAARGSLGAVQEVNRVSTYRGTAGVTVGLARAVGLSGYYTYYRHDLDSTAALAPGVLRLADRHSVSVNVNFWTPLLHRDRRANVAR